MSGDGLIIRPSCDEDLPTIAAIYAHHVLNGLASFEEVPPEIEEIARRRGDIVARGLPYLVAEADGKVLGYCYAGPFRPRVAYRYTLEDSIYIDPAAVGRGIGRVLLTAVLARSEELGYRQMVAVIGDSGNAASIGLHAAMGFRRIGHIEAVGWKHGSWVDSVLMQRPLGPGGGSPPDP